MKNNIADLLRDGEAAVYAGNRAEARHNFRAILMLDPANVPALLWLAWLNNDPRASLAYIARALECDPDNPRAHAALRWARRRVTALALQEPTSPSVPAAPASTSWGIGNRIFGNKPGFWVALGLLLIILIGGGLVWYLPKDVPVLAALASTPTSTSTHTPTPTSTSTHTPTPTLTPSPTLTSTPTHTPTPTPTHTPTST
ncbi:MAG: hypothetical protein SXV54_23545, partial [Chloroflexota bacterium]|nr:hypothetical protein [Chloroflexota bacterium]